MSILSRALVIAATSALLASSAFAQTPAPAKPAAAPATTVAPAAEKSAAKPRSAVSLECSKQADAKGLHGKERKKFRSDCKKTAGKSG